MPVIEDEPSVRELLNRYFDSAGVLTVLARSAEEGLSQAQEIRPDAILCGVKGYLQTPLKKEAVLRALRDHLRARFSGMWRVRLSGRLI